MEPNDYQIVTSENGTNVWGASILMPITVPETRGRVQIIARKESVFFFNLN